MKPQAVVQPTTDATLLEESYHRTPTALGHLLEDLLRAVTALVALAAVVLWWLMATPAAEAAAAGAPRTGLEKEPAAEAIAEAEAPQTTTSPVSHAAATMPVAESRKFNARNLPRQARTMASPPSLLDFAICCSQRNSSL
jgi:type IV secretory pathway VirB10-like protein